MSITAWIDICLVEVVSARGSRFQVKVLERHCEMLINDAPVDHLEPGSTIWLDG